MQVRAQVSRTGWRVLLVSALVLAAVTRQHRVAPSSVCSIGSVRTKSQRPGDERYDGQSCVQQGEYRRQLDRRLRDLGQPRGRRDVRYEGQHLHGRYRAPELGEQLECPGLLCLGYPRRIEHRHRDIRYVDQVIRHRVPARVLRSRQRVSCRRQCVCHRQFGVHEQWSRDDHPGQRPPLRRRCI